MKKKITIPVISRNEAIWDILQETKSRSYGPLGVYMSLVEKNITDHFFFLFDYCGPKTVQDTFFVRLHAFAFSWGHIITRANDTESAPDGKLSVSFIEEKGLNFLREAHSALIIMSGDIRKRYEPEMYEEYLCALIKPLGFRTFREILESGPLKEHDDIRHKVTNWLLYKEGERKAFL